MTLWTSPEAWIALPTLTALMANRVADLLPGDCGDD